MLLIGFVINRSLGELIVKNRQVITTMSKSSQKLIFSFKLRFDS